MSSSTGPTFGEAHVGRAVTAARVTLSWRGSAGVLLGSNLGLRSAEVTC